MKKFFKSILPVSFWNFLRYIKLQKRILVIRIKLLLGIQFKEKRSKIVFEINLAEHCNLNCYGCSNFSCIAEPELVDVNEFQRDLSRMSEIFGHECDRIFLIGGEPLLHPDVIALMKIARENFPVGNIFLFTNGILLPQKEADFWQACHDNNIKIWISAYPIKINIDLIKEKAEKFAVNLEWAWGQNDAERKKFGICAINLKGSSNIKINFAMCGRANNCITLEHGKLFTCTFAPHVRHFNKYFGKNVNITEADYIDIYEDHKPEEILRRLREPIPACRYCSMCRKPTKVVDWGHTKKEINEWL